MKGKTLLEAIGYADEKYVSRPFSKFYVSKTRENASKVWDVVKVLAGVAAVIAVILAIWIPSVLYRGPYTPGTTDTGTAPANTELTSASDTDGITTAEPVVTELPTTEPDETEPPTTEAPATEPPTAEAPATEPPTTEAPVTEPPTTEPPTTEPPVTEPPTTESPVTESPTTDVPVTEPPVILVSSIKINAPSDPVEVGKSITLTAEVKPKNAADKEVIWSVISGASCGTVSSNGTFTAVSAGECTVRAAASDGSGVYAVITIRVTEPEPQIDENAPGIHIIINKKDVTNKITMDSSDDFINNFGDFYKNDHENFIDHLNNKLFVSVTDAVKQIGGTYEWIKDDTVAIVCFGNRFTFNVTKHSMKTAKCYDPDWMTYRMNIMTAFYRANDDLMINYGLLTAFMSDGEIASCGTSIREVRLKLSFTSRFCDSPESIPTDYDFVTENGITYKLYEEWGEKVAAVIECDEEKTGPVAVLSVCRGYPVKYVAPHAFYGIDGITEITLPDSIERLDGPYDFAECKNLKKITFPKDLRSISANACENCVSLQTVVFPQKMNEIGAYAFSGCKKLVIDAIGGVYDRVSYFVKIGDHAFYNCESIKNLTLHLEWFYGDSSFENCVNLESVEYVYNQPMFCGNFTFRNTGLTSVTLKKGTSFDGNGKHGYGTFMDCKKLTYVSLERGVRPCAYMFANCTALSLDNVHIYSAEGSTQEYPAGIFSGIYAERVYLSKYANVGTNAFDTVGTIEYIVEEGNIHGFYALDGMLMQGSILMQFPSGKTGSVYLPKEISRIYPGAMSRGTLDALYISANVKTIDSNAIKLHVKDIYFEGNTTMLDNSLTADADTVVHCVADSNVYRYCTQNGILTDTENVWDGVYPDGTNCVAPRKKEYV